MSSTIVLFIKLAVANSKTSLSKIYLMLILVCQGTSPTCLQRKQLKLSFKWCTFTQQVKWVTQLSMPQDKFCTNALAHQLHQTLKRNQTLFRSQKTNTKSVQISIHRHCEYLSSFTPYKLVVCNVLVLQMHQTMASKTVSIP